MLHFGKSIIIYIYIYLNIYNTYDKSNGIIPIFKTELLILTINLVMYFFSFILDPPIIQV
jgi:hypothetical protein